MHKNTVAPTQQIAYTSGMTAALQHLTTVSQHHATKGGSYAIHFRLAHGHIGFGGMWSGSTND
jgi:hypothetical protein